MSDPTTPAAWANQFASLWMVCGQGFPVDVKEIALEVTKTRFSDPVGLVRAHGIQGIDGILSKRKRGDWCISYDETITVPGRINFTLGHEFGHYLLHRKIREEGFQCGQAEMLDYESPESRKFESEANKFASYLLMPATDFRSQIEGQVVTLDLLGHCANRYGTSFTATALKWVELTDQPALLAMARDGFICWSYPSRRARLLRTYLPPGTPVPQSSLRRLNSAADINRRNQGSRVPPGVWHPELEAEEFVIISDHFDLAIFLVRFPYAGMVEQAEEKDWDAFTFFENRAQG
ncbi:protein of unknown function [Nitrosospira multiformis ATCC 25196]|uniref:IrrE N-terminal-like domain-containing protein n=1 Tax=Nitrosospira multiformis (strain ATCC 25196 / NCIMB 11849 / C 71) TaxID=323848 RepID=Q2Y586_NITMU|nr:ImmA/IrrE family metallo-endopeptidase [Nitrosospira multiformis]ABB76085.1 Protein of unknown function DUF955 [Nitrosospira multiformis ATCC 25196]SEG16724.1 protein of unknown function [Nitrosospira multiformis ATCC 25196]